MVTPERIIISMYFLTTSLFIWCKCSGSWQLVSSLIDAPAQGTIALGGHEGTKSVASNWVRGLVGISKTFTPRSARWPIKINNMLIF